MNGASFLVASWFLVASSLPSRVDGEMLRSTSFTSSWDLTYSAKAALDTSKNTDFAKEYFIFLLAERSMIYLNSSSSPRQQEYRMHLLLLCWVGNENAILPVRSSQSAFSQPKPFKNPHHHHQEIMLTPKQCSQYVPKVLVHRMISSPSFCLVGM